MKKLKDGLYNIGTIKENSFSTIINVNLNNGTVILNNFNKGNAGSWNDILKISDIMRQTCKTNFSFKNEQWYKLYKKFIQTVNKEEFNNMIEKMNSGIIV